MSRGMEAMVAEMRGSRVDGCGTGFQPVRGMLERVGVDDWAEPFAWAGSPCHAERFAWAGSPCHVELFAWAGSPCDRFATVESPCRSSAAPRAREHAVERSRTIKSGSAA